MPNNEPSDRQAITPVAERYEGDNNPYRGTQSHGVAATDSPTDVVPGWEDGTVATIVEPKHKGHPPVVVTQAYDVRLSVADGWAADTRVLGSSNPVMLQGRNTSRRSITVTNQGATLVYLAATNGVTQQGFGGCALPAGAARVIASTGEVWALSPTSDGVVDYVTEYN